jgi:hypothetical protein
MEQCLALDLQPIDMKAWLHVWVGLYCRMAHTLATGAVWSKKAGQAWALANLDLSWREFIVHSQAVGKGSDAGWDPVPPQDADQARDFARYVLAWATERSSDASSRAAGGD